MGGGCESLSSQEHLYPNKGNFVPIYFLLELENPDITSITQKEHLPRVGMAWWCMLVIPALERLRREDCKFKATLGCLSRFCFKRERGREGGREKDGRKGMERKRGREGERERKHIYFHNQISPLIFK
jgi:hypothetical protein